eukprot:scaffold86594_cov22-Tisochrysis_lutea.AAC.1
MLQSHTHHVQAKVQALYATDQQWYNGTVEAVSASGNLLVNYEGYDETTEVPCLHGCMHVVECVCDSHIISVLHVSTAKH